MFVAITFYEAFRLKNRIWRSMLKRPGVTGIGVGYADPSKPSSGAAVILYTSKRLPTNVSTLLLEETGKLTQSSSVPFRLVRSGTFKNEAARPKQTGPRQRWRPTPGGVSVGTDVPQAVTGTGGLIVTKNNSLFLLSNAHVLVPTNRNIFHNTVQPGPADAGRSPRDLIGRAYQFVPLQTGTANYQDSAIAIANSNSLLNPRYMINTNGGLITVPGHLRSYRVGMTFKRMGRTSGFGRGVVEAIGVDLRINYGGSLGILMFRDQTVVRFTQGRTGPGDSGSVWLNDASGSLNNYATAIHYAGSDGTRSICFPIDRPMRSYGTRVAVPAAGGFRGGEVKGSPLRNNHSYVRPISASQLAKSRAVRIKVK